MEGLRAAAVEPSKPRNPFSLIAKLRGKFARIPVAQKLFLVQQLSIMVKTGISLAVALKTIAEQTGNKTLKVVLSDVQHEVERGNTFAKGLERHRAVFGDLFISMIAGGEASGKLEEVLNQLFIQLKRDHALVAKVRGAMIYPAVIIVAMIGVAILTMIFVIPNLLTIFEEVDVPLPLATRILIGISNGLTSYGIFVVLGLALLITVFVRIVHLPGGRYAYHWLLLRLPVAGVIIRKINIARFCRTFSSLLKTDIAIIRSFEITADVVGNELYRRLLREAKEKVKRGLNIKESLTSDMQLFPPVVLQMVAVGEETGALDNVLEESAQFYENDVDQTMTTLPSLIEPILIVVLGLGVAGMAMAVIMPMYSISQNI
ncbi:MAG: Uncharacterized protein G01um101431_339 [Parcubacteria group bacterium Gr01-1014_31]|nr:MAG: Uncharacterized protein G01um101431_339 [Parcubacteria group bacterium Gr01-1014_31]